MLKRHLSTDHQMTPDDYRIKWGLPPSYPMVTADTKPPKQRLSCRRCPLTARSSSDS
jgi:predicted transcriptional regulator